MSIGGPGSAGMQVNRFLDALGYPDKFGDAIGALTDLKTGNMAGAFRNLVDLNSGLTTGQMDRMFGKGAMPGFGKGTFPRLNFSGPHLYNHRGCYAHHEQVGKRAHIGQKFGFKWGPFKLQGRISGRQYVGSFAKPIKLANNQFLYKGNMYKNMGAIFKDARDGRVDGKATHIHHRPPFGFGMNPGLGMIGNMLQGVNLGAPSQILNQIFNQAGGLFGGIPGGIPGMGGAQGPGGTSGAGGGTGGTGGASSGAGGAGGPSVLSNPNLTMEDKLALLMAKLSEHLDKQIEEKMGEIEKAMQQEQSGKSGGAQGGGKAGGGGGILGGLGGSLGQLGSLAGMGVGMMYGGPLGGSIGSALGGKAGNLLGGILGGGSKAGGAGGAGAAGGAEGDGKKPNLQLLQTQLQQILQKRQQMFQTMSSILKSLHDTSMNAIRNLKA